MSQSDYIKHLKLATELKQQQTDFQPVLESRNYTLFKEYTIVNTVANTAPLYGQLSSPGIVNIFEMPTPDISNCPSFIVCRGTNNRPYRVAMKSVYYTPRPVVGFVKQPSNHKCSVCCYDTAVNSTIKKVSNKSNFFNSNLTTCSNYRLKKMRCNCSVL